MEVYHVTIPQQTVPFRTKLRDFQHELSKKLESGFNGISGQQL